MFLGLVDTREPRPDRKRREPLWLDIAELRPWRWFLATIAAFVVAGLTGGVLCLVATICGLGFALGGVTRYFSGNDGMREYRQ
jgi:hypothetical protein